MLGQLLLYLTKNIVEHLMKVLNFTQRLHMASKERFFFSRSAFLSKSTNTPVCQGLLIFVPCVVEQSKQVH